MAIWPQELVLRWRDQLAAEVPPPDIPHWQPSVSPPDLRRSAAQFIPAVDAAADASLGNIVHAKRAQGGARFRQGESTALSGAEARQWQFWTRTLQLPRASIGRGGAPGTRTCAGHAQTFVCAGLHCHNEWGCIVLAFILTRTMRSMCRRPPHPQGMCSFDRGR